MTIRLDRRDMAWTLGLAAAFLAGLGASWQRWANPLIDCGREMQIPLRLAAGEVLYADVRHIYGPLSPYVHAALFRAFGPSLGILYADGALCAVAALAMTYWIARRLMAPLPAGTATLGVMWLCVFKPAGNYIAPYSYNALHGAVLSLATVVLSILWLERQRDDARRAGSRPLAMAAGVAAGLAILAKTEMGAAAVATGFATAWVVLPARPDGERVRPAYRPGLAFLMSFLAAAGGIATAGYGWMASVAGWHALAGDSYLLLYNVPPALAHYNAWVSGLDHPLRSLGRILIASAKMSCLAAIVLALSQFVGRRPVPYGAPVRPAASGRIGPLPMLAAALVLLLVMSLVTGFDMDKGPYLAMPVLLAWLLWVQVRRLAAGEPAGNGEGAADPRVLAVCAVSALVSLGRMILHVRSGGAYGSYLLPLSVVLFTYMWTVPFGAWAERRTGRRLASDVFVWLLLVDAVLTAGLLGYRYRTRYTFPIVSSRGTIVAEPAIGLAWQEARAFIDSHTRPGEPVAVVPEGTSLLFLSERSNPLREEITTPGYLDEAAEARAIAQLQAAGTRLVLITNRGTPEFGARRFGIDYSIRLVRWIESSFDVCGQFGPGRDPALRVGDRPFFIRAYCRQDTRDSRLPIAD